MIWYETLMEYETFWVCPQTFLICGCQEKYINNCKCDLMLLFRLVYLTCSHWRINNKTKWNLTKRSGGRHWVTISSWASWGCGCGSWPCRAGRWAHCGESADGTTGTISSAAAAACNTNVALPRSAFACLACKLSLTHSTKLEHKSRS